MSAATAHGFACRCVPIKMSPTYYSRVWIAVCQCALVLPATALGTMNQAFQNNHQLMQFQISGAVSLLVAIVAMLGFVHLVEQIAPPRAQIVQQFYVMKGVIAASKFTKTIIVSVGVGAYASDPDRYSDEVMSHGVGCFVSLMIMPFVAMACRKYYVVDLEALKQPDEESYREMMAIT